MARSDAARNGYSMKLAGTKLRDLASTLLACMGSFIGGTLVLGEEILGSLGAVA